MHFLLVFSLSQEFPLLCLAIFLRIGMGDC